MATRHKYQRLLDVHNLREPRAYGWQLQHQRDHREGCEGARSTYVACENLTEIYLGFTAILP